MKANKTLDNAAEKSGIVARKGRTIIYPTQAEEKNQLEEDWKILHSR